VADYRDPHRLIAVAGPDGSPLYMASDSSLSDPADQRLSNQTQQPRWSFPIRVGRWR
jgi:hypothetical protein